MILGYDHSIWGCAKFLRDKSLGLSLYSSPPYQKVRQSTLTERSFSKSWAIDQGTSSSVGLVFWYDIVHDYSSGLLTVEVDSLMGFEGIALCYARNHDLAYVAGLYPEHMPLALS